MRRFRGNGRSGLLLKIKVCLCLLSGLATAQTVGGRLYEAVKPSFVVQALAEDSAGFLWTGTSVGLYRLGGYGYVPVGRWAGLSDVPVTALAIAADDTPWVGTGTGLYHIRGAQAARLSSEPVTELHAAGQGVYAVSGRFVYWHIENGVWKSKTVSAPLPIGTLHHQDDAIIYPCAGDVCRVRWNGTRFELQREPAGVRSGPWIEALQVEHQLFLASHRAHAYLTRETTSKPWRQYDSYAADSQARQLVFSARDRSGLTKVWVMFKGYVAEANGTIKPNFLIPYPIRDPKQVIALSHDPLAYALPDGAVNGILLVDPVSPLWTWNAEFGLNAGPTSVHQVNGRILATTTKGIYELVRDPAAPPCKSLQTPRPAPYFCKLPGSSDDYYYSVTADPLGRIWAINRRLGVVQLKQDGTIVTIAPSPDQRMESSLRDIICTHDGRVFIASKWGMLELNDGHETRLTFVPGFSPDLAKEDKFSHYVAEFNRAKSGEWWAAVEGGVARYRGGRWQRMSLPCLLTDKVSTAAIENENSIWIGYRANLPVTHLSRKSVQDEWSCRHSAESQTVVPSTHFLHFDSRGNLWRGDADALHVLQSQTAVENGGTPADTGHWIDIGPYEGLSKRAPVIGGFWEDDRGDVWVSVDEAIDVFPKAFRWHWEQKFMVSGVEWDGGADWLGNSGWHTDWKGKTLRRLHFASLPLSANIAPPQVFWRAVGDRGEPITSWQEATRGIAEIGEVTPDMQRLEFRSQNAKPLGEFVLRPASFYSRFRLWLGFVGLVAASAVWWGLGRIGQRAEYWWLKDEFLRFKDCPLGERERRLAQIPTERRKKLEALLAEAPAVDDMIGTKLGDRFVIEHLVAKGGFASVYFGRDLQRQREPVAIKLIRFRPDLSEWIDRRWRLEQKALEMLNHPGIVQPRIASITEDNQLYIVTEYIEGVTVRAALARGPMETGRALARTCEVCEALEYAHKNGILHCDLKPDNIMLRNVGQPDERAVVIDFGTVVLFSSDRSVMDSGGRAMGAQDYMPPERLGGKLSTATDVFSLAATVFEMLTGVRWRDAEATGRIESLLKSVPRASVSQQDSVELVRVFLTATAFDAHSRTRTVVEFRQAIREAIKQD